jgi:hypothetical protein
VFNRTACILFLEKKEKHMATLILQTPDQHILYLLTLALSPKKHQVYGSMMCTAELVALIEKTASDLLLVQYPIENKNCQESLGQHQAWPSKVACDCL